MVSGDASMSKTVFHSCHERPQTRKLGRKGLREVLVLNLSVLCHRVRNLIRPGSDAERLSILFQRFPSLYTAFPLIRSGAPPERTLPFIGLHLKGWYVKYVTESQGDMGI